MMTVVDAPEFEPGCDFIDRMTHEGPYVDTGFEDEDGFRYYVSKSSVLEMVRILAGADADFAAQVAGIVSGNARCVTCGGKISDKVNKKTLVHVVSRLTHRDEILKKEVAAAVGAIMPAKLFHAESEADAGAPEATKPTKRAVKAKEPVACPECGREFGSKFALTGHMQTHKKKEAKAS